MSRWYSTSYFSQSKMENVGDGNVWITAKTLDLELQWPDFHLKEELVTFQLWGQLAQLCCSKDFPGAAEKLKIDLYTTSVWRCLSAQINFIHCDHIWLFTKNLRTQKQSSLSCNQAFLCLVRAVLQFLFWILSLFLILSLQSPHQQRYVSSLVLELLISYVKTAVS